MKSIKATKAYVLSMSVLSVFACNMPTAAVAGPGALGSATSFGVFGGGAGMTNQGLFTVINGNIGTTASTPLVTGFHDLNAVFTETPLNIGTVNGTVHTATAPAGSVPNAIAAAVALDIQAAFDNLSPAALPGGIDVSSLGGGPGELGNRTLAPGVYKSAPGSFAIKGGDLTLDGRGDVNAVWVFQMASTLTVGGPGAAFPQSVHLINGAQAKNVFWQVGSSAVINAAGGGTMVGTIIASSGAAFSTSGNVDVVTLNGRALALHASVTLVNTHINVPEVIAAPVDPPVVVVPPIVPATPGVTVTGTQAADVIATASTGGVINVQNNGGHVAVTENGTGTINIVNNGQSLTATNTGNGVMTINNTCTAAVTVTNTGNGNITVNATGSLPITLTYADGVDHTYP